MCEWGEEFYDDEDVTDPDYEEDNEEFECGAYRGMDHKLLGCSMAGSEECDFECSFRETVERSLRAQAGWQKRKARVRDTRSSHE